MKLTVYDTQAQEVDSIEADDLVFGLPPHAAALRQALLAQLANRRAGSANTKTRGEVTGSTRKMWRQKGTGHARQGAKRAPHWRGGGVAFGPKPRSYKQALPKMVRRLAIRSALSTKVGDGELKVVRGLDLDAPKTKAVVELLGRFDWGCKHGEHIGWAVVEAQDQATARRLLPTTFRDKARVFQLTKFTPEDVKSFQAGH